MRVNVYAEERAGFESGSKEIDGGKKMYWLRVKLKSHPSMVPPEHQDDDSPAVTFWFYDVDEAYAMANLMLITAMQLK